MRCRTCGKELPVRSRNQKIYCNSKCQKEMSNAYRRVNTDQASVPTKLMGTYSELFVILDLYKKGYEVYRAVSAHCTGDIVFEKDGSLLKIDATTGGINKNGTYSHPKKGSSVEKNSIIIAVNLTDENRVVYFKNGKEIIL